MTLKKPLKMGGFLQTIRVIIPHTGLHTFAVLAQRSDENDKSGNKLQVAVRHTCKTIITANKESGDVDESPFTLVLLLQPLSGLIQHEMIMGGYFISIVSNGINTVFMFEQS